nr:OmpA family protein [uncultured Rhodopila sp.]
MLHCKILAAAVATVGFVTLSAATAQSVMERVPAGSTTYPIHFPTGSYQLDPGDQDTIRAVASKIQADSALHATIVGKADTTGSAEFNEHLSERRATTVFEALVYANKAPEDRVDVRWTGEHLPVVTTDDQQAESQNRIVAIILHKAQ